MDENEFYYEEDKPSRTRILCLILLVIFTIVLISFMVYRRMHTLNIRENLVFELGSTVPSDVEAYLRNKVFNADNYKINLKKVPMADNKFSAVGKYEFKISYNKVSKKGILEVKDTTAPIVEVQKLTVGVDEDYVVDDFIARLDELSLPCTVNYKNEADENLQAKAGTYSFDIIIKDSYGNATTKTVKLEVAKDANLERTKKEDLEVSYIDPNYDDWQGIFFKKAREALPREKIEDDEDFAFLYDYSDADYAKHLPSEYQGHNITHVATIYAYNKWNYVIGVIVRAELENGSIIYLES